MSEINQEPVQLPRDSQAKLQKLVDKTQSRSMALRLWEKLHRDEKERLGGDAEAAIRDHGSAGALYAAVYGCESPAESVVKAAAKLKLIDGDLRAELLEEIYRAEGHRGSGVVPVLDELPEDIEYEIKLAKSNHRLVIAEGSGIRWVFWDGQYLDIDWANQLKAWVFIWELARTASRRQSLDRNDLASTGPVDMKERARGLRKALTKTEELTNLSEPFIELISTGEENTYRLNLRKTEIWQRHLTGSGWECELDAVAREKHDHDDPE